MQGILLPGASRLLLSSTSRHLLLSQHPVMDPLTMQQASSSSRPQLLVLPLPSSCCQSSSLLPNLQGVRAHWSQSWSAGPALHKQLGLQATQPPFLLFP